MPDDAAVPAPVEQSPPRTALVAGLVGAVVMAALTGWLSARGYQDHRADEQRTLFVQTARQGAVNLTTIDYEHADADVQRILDSATGSFHKTFAQGWRPLIDLVKRDRSKLVGTVTDIGLESQRGDTGQVLVAVIVKSSNPQHAQRQPQLWRMRITVQQEGDQGKLANVAFVS